MNRLIMVISPLVVILTLLFNTDTSGQEAISISCLKCHEDVYRKAVSYKYQHSVVRDKCPLCHITPEKEDEIISYLRFPGLHRECLIYLDRLSETQDYQVEVTLTDSNGKSCAPDRIDIAPKNAWEPDGERSSFKLKKLSRVTVDEIKRRGFVRAVISWDTDVYATSEIEYRLTGDRSSTFKIKDLYTKDHKIILDGLKHSNRYYFRAVSRDVYGNMLKSEEYHLDTAEEFSRPELKEDDPTPPVINHMQAFRTPGNEGLYLKVSANKLCEISIRIKEVKKKDEKHGLGLLPARYSRIDICYKCHPHDSSHPVGVKAESPKIRTPDGLPTIEDGIITCVTCHTPHGGDRVYFNRFDFRKDLCMRCHLQKYDNL
jgi:predicted CXXCH cytochrome family protein